MEGADLLLVVEGAMVAFPLLGLAQRPDIYSCSDHSDRRLHVLLDVEAFGAEYLWDDRGLAAGG